MIFLLFHDSVTEAHIDPGHPLHAFCLIDVKYMKGSMGKRAIEMLNRGPENGM